MVFHKIPGRHARAGARGARPPLIRRISFPSLGIAVLAGTLITGIAACASGPPSINDPDIGRKIDLRLRTALSQPGWSEELGDYVQVIVRMNRNERPEDREAISELGAIGTWSGRILTLTIAPDRVVSLAANRHVEYVELSMRNAPAPVPPPVEEGP